MTVRPNSVTVLILGAGWTSTFLIPLLKSSSPPITHAATTRDGRSSTYRFTFNPTIPATDPSDRAQYRALPTARVVLITFPLLGEGAPGELISRYEASRPRAAGTDDATDVKPEPEPVYVLLGSTSIWTHPGVIRPSDPPAYRAPSPGDGSGGPGFPSDNPRARAEDALLGLVPGRAAVLCLCGLYGGERVPKKWAGRVAGSKEAVAGKKGVQFVHGADVARGIKGVVEAVVGRGERGGAEGKWEALRGKRWIVTDLRVYDWWDMLLTWDETEGGEDAGESKEEKLPYARWVRELMWEQHVPALPRPAETLGRVLDGTEFWQILGLAPSVGRMQ